MANTKKKLDSKANLINAFAALVANKEQGKGQAKMGDISQVLKIVDEQLNGGLYAMIRLKFEIPDTTVEEVQTGD